MGKLWICIEHDIVTNIYIVLIQLRYIFLSYVIM